MRVNDDASLKQRVCAAVAALSMILVLFAGMPEKAAANEVAAQGITFSDVPPGAPFYDDITWLANSGITTGWPDGTFRPTTSIKRDSMAAFLYRLSGSPDFSPPKTSPFSDITPATPFYKEITWLADSGITTGWADGTFRPVDPVNRDAMAAYLFRLSRQSKDAISPSTQFSDVPTSQPFAIEIAWLSTTGITQGWPDGTFRPTSTVNRDAMAAFMHRYVTGLGNPVPTLRATVTEIGATSVTLELSIPDGASAVVRRGPGVRPPATLTDGVEVPLTDLIANDTDLSPATEYSYSVWVDQGGTAPATTGLYGPVTYTVGTADYFDTSVATYVVSPGAAVLDGADIAATSVGASGVSLSTTAEAPLPAVGSGVVLPISPDLPGGFVGIVQSVSSDGHTVALAQGGLADVFDYFYVSASLDDVELVEVADPQAAPAALPAPTREEQARRSREGPTSAAAGVPSCLQGGLTGTLDFDPGFETAGHFRAGVNKKSILGVGIPTGVWLDTRATMTMSAAMSAQVRGSASCGLDLPKVMAPIVTAPVPISILFDPSVGIEVQGGVDISNVGFAATAGFSASATMSLNGSIDARADLIKEFVPLTPSVDAYAGGISAKVSGALTIGPGAGSKDAGVIFGIGGTLTPVDIGVVVSVPTQAGLPVCTIVKAGGELDINLSAKAWLGKFTATAQTSLLKPTWSYGEPWSFPRGCEQPPPNPSENVLGDGVTMVDDQVNGSPGQWGYLTGFDGNNRSWVLSTGFASDANRGVGYFASTEMDSDGDDLLSALAGYPTADAAAYSVKVVPTGSTLHVKYVFASEEYPEFVGSQYNDVMAVTISGQNCALVPGTSTPISINTVNNHSFAEYYIDNAAGGDSAVTYDGMTVPLTCSVPVQPGVPVDVRISLADASDGIYDSAVALIDQGIWSD